MLYIKITATLLFLSFFGKGEMKELRQDFDRAAFYSVLASGNVDKINTELTIIGASSIHEKEAYEGVLLMKKAGLVRVPAEKLKFFKSGRIKLETALARDSANGELHFLRLIIQEHAPRIVKYSADLEKDSGLVHHTFNRLSPAVKQAIIDYSRKSKILRPEDF
ncbi:MAG TPA: hypothetical protein VL832_04750 [Puia sp.]|nr:hypothetical protein [Puia sp.]